MRPNSPNIVQNLAAIYPRLAQCFGAALGGVRFEFVEGLPVAGCAAGSRILVDVDVLDRGSEVLLRVLAHEMAHIVQQRQGRARPLRRIGGVGIDDSPALEAEAEWVAGQVRRGRFLAPEFTGSVPLARDAEIVLQPLIVLDGNRVAQASDLSAKLQSTVALIKDGPDWLASALPAAAPVYFARNEADLARQIQWGLHATPLLSFPAIGLQMPPSMMVNLSDADFSALLPCIQKSQLSTAAQAVLSQNGIRTAAQLAGVTQVLQSLGVTDSFPGQGLTFSDQLALYNAWIAPGASQTPTSADQPAASFAVSVAAGPAEFLPAFGFYQYVASKMPGADATSVGGQASGLWTALAPEAMKYLRCLVAYPEASGTRISGRLNAWLNQGHVLGFQTIASANWNLAANGQASADLKTADSAAIDAYIIGAQKFLSTAELAMRESQDGLSTFYSCEGSGGAAQLQLDAANCLTFSLFRPSAVKTS